MHKPFPTLLFPPQLTDSSRHISSYCQNVSGFSNFLLLLGYYPPLTDLVSPSPAPGDNDPVLLFLLLLLFTVSNEKEKETVLELELVPKRYRPDNITALCEATGYVLFFWCRNLIHPLLHQHYNNVTMHNHGGKKGQHKCECVVY